MDFDATLEPVVEKATATSSKGNEPMTSKQAPLWIPKKDLSKVELPSKNRYQRKSSRIRDRVGFATRDLDFILEIMAFFEDESPKDADLIAPSIAIKPLNLRQDQPDQLLKRKIEGYTQTKGKGTSSDRTV